MYSVKPQILEFAALLLKHGIRHAVVCAGSRNAPIAHTLASIPEIECLPCVDERSGAFTALGMSQALGEPVVFCCTSGSALLDASPAVAEAFYQEVPVLVVSADRPTAWIDQLDAQTLRQTGAIRNFVRFEADLPEPKDKEDMWHCNRLLNEAMLALRGKPKGPVHVNMPISEPLFDLSAKELPSPRVIQREETSSFVPSQAMKAEWGRASRPLLIAGQLSPSNELQKSLETLARQGCIVVTEQLSNLGGLEGQENVVHLAEQIFAAPELSPQGSGQAAKELAPDFIATFGGHVVSKRLKLFLRRFTPESNWHISQSGSTPDLFCSLTRAVEGDAKEVLEALAGLPRQGKDEGYLKAWNERNGRAQRQIADSPSECFCDVEIARRAVAALPENAALQLANSSPLRNAGFFSLPAGTKVFCNRGVNGIDGSLSAAVGYARKTDFLVFCLIGDLSFFYDQNALWQERLPVNLRVLLFNNGGGGIFHLLPGLNSPHRDPYIAGRNTRSAKELAASIGASYSPCRNFEELNAALPSFTSQQPAERPMILEVFTSMDESADEARRLTKASC